MRRPDLKKGSYQNGKFATRKLDNLTREIRMVSKLKLTVIPENKSPEKPRKRQNELEM